jgi:hypothetical protein
MKQRDVMILVEGEEDLLTLLYDVGFPHNPRRLLTTSSGSCSGRNESFSKRKRTL